MARRRMRRSALIRDRRPPASLLRSSITTMTQGVSQQPEHLRPPGQGEEQVNGWSSPVEGLSKRRPTIFRNKLLASNPGELWAETMLVATGERYQLLLWRSGSTTYLQPTLDGASVDIDVHGTGLSTTTLNGKTVVTGTSGSYLATAGSLLEGYVLTNQGALGLLLNREKTVAMDSALSPSQANEALVFIQGVTYDVTYTVTLDEGLGTQLVATFSTPLATASPNKISTSTTASNLRATIDASPNWVATQVGPVVYIQRNTGADFTIKVDDDRSNTLARAIKGTVEVFSDLPVQARGGMIIRVESDPSRSEDDFWVKFVRSDGGATSYGKGSWQETVAPGIEYQLDSDTMPLVIYRAASGKLYVGPADGASRTLSGAPNYTFPLWGERTAGDEETVPSPSFVGRQIKDHLIFRSRYAVAGGESVVLSETDDAFNFFADTSVQVLETDPIDVRASSESSVALQWLVPANEVLLAFSDREQFAVRASGDEVLSPRSAVCDLLSKIESNVRVRPRAAGPGVMFAAEDAGNTSFREYQGFESGRGRLGLNLGSSQEATLAVPKYVQGLTDWWDVGENLDYMVVMTPADSTTLYVYKYLWQNQNGSLFKSQSSWSKWTFDGDVLWARFFDNDLNLLMGYDDGLYSVTLTAEELDEVDVPGYYLDRQILFPECNADSTSDNNVVASYDAVSDTTTFTLPYQIASDTVAVVRYDNDTTPGVPIGSASSGTSIACSVRGDFTGEKVVIGARYQFRYDFTRAYLPQRDQGGQRLVGQLSGRLQVATWEIHYTDTGAFDVVVERLNRANASRHSFLAIRSDIENNVLDDPANVLLTGVFRVPVMAKNTECRVRVESDSFLPVRLSGASWEGNYTDRARGVG